MNEPIRSFLHPSIHPSVHPPLPPSTHLCHVTQTRLIEAFEWRPEEKASFFISTYPLPVLLPSLPSLTRVGLIPPPPANCLEDQVTRNPFPESDSSEKSLMRRDVAWACTFPGDFVPQKRPVNQKKINIWAHSGAHARIRHGWWTQARHGHTDTSTDTDNRKMDRQTDRQIDWWIDI